MTRTSANNFPQQNNTFRDEQRPIQLHPDNPHYFLFRGRPAVLVTSAEHYGAVINLDFDYVAYFDALARRRLNYTRIYPGGYIEKDGEFMPDNVLGPRENRLILPWARSNMSGFALGGNKFDLDIWDGAYFARLRDFLQQANERDIVVEICFFNSQYQHNWQAQALNAANNIQDVGRCTAQEVQTLKDEELVARQEAYIRKITQEVNPYPNAILEICDEPGISGTPVEESGPWVSRLLDVVCEAEAQLPNKHLLTQQVTGPLGGPGDFSRDRRVSLVTGQYTYYIEAGEQHGGLTLLDAAYDCNKPIEINETNYYPIWYQGDAIAASRVEGWEFMVGGGGAFNHLTGLFTVHNPAGTGEENDRILTALTALRDYLDSFNFLRMSPDMSFVVDGIPAGVFARGMSEPGRQYALYLHHSLKHLGSYEVQPGDYQHAFTLNIPQGDYTVEWIDPATGTVSESRQVAHAGGHLSLSTPQYSVDIALRIMAST